MWSRSANIRTTQEEFRGALWAIHMLEVPRTSFIPVAWPLTQIQFLKRKKRTLPTLLHRLHTPLQGSQPTTARRSAHLPWRSFFLILAPKETFTNERALYQACSTSRRKFKFLCRTVVSKRKLPKPKCYALWMVEKATFCHILPSGIWQRQEQYFLYAAAPPCLIV